MMVFINVFRYHTSLTEKFDGKIFEIRTDYS